jgi:hypothetical protein
MGGLAGIGAVALTLAGPSPALGWSTETQIAIANHGTLVTPSALRRQIERHRRQYHQGVMAPFRDTEAARHAKNSDGRGRLDRVIAQEVERAVQAIEGHRPFAEVVHQLGVISHYLADANYPLNASDADPRERAYFADYLRYVDRARPRFSVVYYGGPPVETPRELRQLVRQTLDRSVAFYPGIGREYRRIGASSGSNGFDDRSTAFGVGSLAYSHAVSDIARVLRYIWLRAGGADRSKLPTLSFKQRVLLSPSAHSR